MTNSEICSQSIPCEDVSATVPGMSTSYEGVTHAMNVKQTGVVMGVEHEFMSFRRIFSISGRDNGDSGITAMVRGPNGDSKCISGDYFNFSGGVSEDCTQTLIIPMYLNLADKIFVYEKRIELIQFSAGVHPHKAIFRQKFGNVGFWKYVIRKESREYLQVRQEFHIVQDGVDTLLHTASQDKNPFDGGQPSPSWGLYGNSVVRLNDEQYDSSIRQILLFPIPPSLGIPIDLCGAACSPSVNNYGFYDYNSVEGGFTLSDLACQDGGKDFYYPYWLRQMTENPVVREWADARWAKNWLHEEVPNGDWTPPEPTTYGWPFGSFVKDAAGNYIHSAIFTDLNGESFLYNRCSPSDIFEKITASGGGNQLYCPVTIISETISDSEMAGVEIDPEQLTVSGTPITYLGESIHVS